MAREKNIATGERDRNVRREGKIRDELLMCKVASQVLRATTGNTSGYSW